MCEGKKITINRGIRPYPLTQSRTPKKPRVPPWKPVETPEELRTQIVFSSPGPFYHTRRGVLPYTRQLSTGYAQQYEIERTHLILSPIRPTRTLLIVSPIRSTPTPTPKPIRSNLESVGKLYLSPGYVIRIRRHFSRSLFLRVYICLLMLSGQRRVHKQRRW